MISNTFQQIFTKLKFNKIKKTTVSVEIPKERSASDYIALVIASGGGIGYMPIVPATWGSLVGVGIYLLAQKANEYFAIWAVGKQFSFALIESTRVSFTLVFLIALLFIGIWSATRVEKLTGKKDPSVVVIDEIFGQLLAFLFIPAKIGWWIILVGFITFRVFDILKPYPTDRFESLPKGLGIMADDAMAGFYTAAFISLLYSVQLFYL
jgi:phosphatidylglycerophosphatase A